MGKRYQHILVPLDGSELAELALGHALSLAELCQSDITLLQVVLPLEHVIGDENHLIYVDQQWASQRDLALQYLKKIYKRDGPKNIKIHLAVELGPPAETIIDYSHQKPIDIIVMATHGRTGLQRWVYGSVADKVLRGAGVPVLLVRAHDQPKAA